MGLATDSAMAASTAAACCACACCSWYWAYAAAWYSSWGTVWPCSESKNGVVAAEAAEGEGSGAERFDDSEEVLVEEEAVEPGEPSEG